MTRVYYTTGPNARGILRSPTQLVVDSCGYLDPPGAGAIPGARPMFVAARGAAGSVAGATPPRQSHPSCIHTDTLRLQGYGSYSDTCRERDEFAAEFPDRFVSPVVRSQTGAWEWTFCAECPREE
jgi:hypothetical protein